MSYIASMSDSFCITPRSLSCVVSAPKCCLLMFCVSGMSRFPSRATYIGITSLTVPKLASASIPMKDSGKAVKVVVLVLVLVLVVEVLVLVVEVLVEVLVDVLVVLVEDVDVEEVLVLDVEVVDVEVVVAHGISASS